MGKQLGVKFEFHNGTFDGLITGLRSKRYDIAMSAMSDTKDREKGVDPDTGKKVGRASTSSTTSTAGTSILVKKGNPEDIKSLDDLCGKTIAIQRGTSPEDLAKARAEKCTSEGKKTISVQTFDTDTEALTPAPQRARRSPTSRLPGRGLQREDLRRRQGLRGRRRPDRRPGPYGIAVRKDNTKLRDALQAALNAIIKDGDVPEDPAEVGRRGGRA